MLKIKKGNQMRLITVLVFDRLDKILNETKPEWRILVWRPESQQMWFPFQMNL